jgi:hypothetical protein
MKFQTRCNVEVVLGIPPSLVKKKKKRGYQYTLPTNNVGDIGTINSRKGLPVHFLIIKIIKRLMKSLISCPIYRRVFYSYSDQ